MCPLPRTNDCIQHAPLPDALSLPVECALSFPDRNAAWSEKVLSQPTEGGLEPQTLICLETEFGNRCGWAKRNSLKPRRLIMMHGGQAASGAVKAFSPLKMNLPYYQLKEWENCPFQEHLRLLTSRSGTDRASCSNDQNVQ